MKKNTRPFLKWAGSKYRSLDKILPALPLGNRLIEPFVGSGAVFINAEYPNTLLAEDNGDLIRLFQQLSEEGESFIRYCESFFMPSNNEVEAYNHLRDTFNRSTDKRLKSALFLYLNRHGYNGLCRYNKKGHYNVPFGRYQKLYFPAHELRHFHQKSQGATFVHHDFRETFKQACPGDIIYCDPPYAPLNQSSNFSSYTAYRFGEADQVCLAELAKASAKKGITVVISNHDTPFTRFHYKEAQIISFPVSRHISCNTEKRIPVQELLAVFCSQM